MRIKGTRWLASILMVIMCFNIVVGSTFAYFTEEVHTTGNIVTAGRLKAGLDYALTAPKTEGDWHDASEGAIFDDQRWEPNYTAVRYLRIRNEGNLAFEYELNVIPTHLVSGSANLMDVIDVYFGVAGDEPITRENYTTLPRIGTLTELVGKENGAGYGILLPENGKGQLPAGVTAHTGEVECVLVLHMQHTAGNEYMNASVGDGFKVQLAATQYTYEKDSFGNNYDEGAELPDVVVPTHMVMNVTPDENGLVPQDVQFVDGEGRVTAVVPQGAKMAEGATQLRVVIDPKAKSDANVSLQKDEVLSAYEVRVEGLAADNTVPARISMGQVLPQGLNIGNYSLYHVENGASNKMTRVDAVDASSAHNAFAYDPATGDVTVAMATFSEVALVAEPAKWEGKRDYSWYDASKTELTIANADQLAGLSAIVGGMAADIEQDSFSGKTVKLIADINLADIEEDGKIFYPIGYNSSDGKYERESGKTVTTGFYNFCGTFDGNGHTISNFYQNTWEMKGDNNYYDATLQYYRDGMGLFGRIYKGTVKNLTVNNFKSDGEYTTTGVIAAYADGATFENIAITDCNPRVYNIGNGGIVGCVGWYAKEAGLTTTFKNITVDNSNKISALWGSYDVACGGIVGQYYPTSGQTSAGTPKNAGIHFENCHVSAQMDVYNDVCGNYQYYAYRYAGMIIGSIRENLPADENGHVYPDMTGISASGCTVNYGDWNDYYYCEYEKNGHPSYSGPDDYKFSRVPNDEIDTSKGKENATCIGHNHTPAEDNQAIYLPFDQLFTGYGWGVTSRGLQDFPGIKTDIDVTVGDQEESVKKFASKFTYDFLYRVGNQNNVALGSLFAAAPKLDNDNNEIVDASGNKVYHNIKDSGVWVSIDKVNENSNVSGTFTANTTDWTKGTIQFSGTGKVKVTIQDYNFCTPTVLYLEVVDAVNATTATNATANNVVLLNDCGFGSLEVSGGYTLYGNGFTMTCGSDSAALDMGYSFVTLNNGTLDNVQIVCPNFDYAVLYKSNMTESGNRKETTDKTRYFNVKSGVMVSGNSQILNSRISGARAAVNVTGGNCVIDNSRIELGAVASVLVGAANSLTLRDVTLVQKPTASTYDSNKKLMGFSVLYMCDSEGKATPTTLEGSFVQQAWVNADDKQYVPSAGQDIVDGVMKEIAYIHKINGKDSLNLGFAYMPEDAQKTVAAPDNITDNRTDKATIPYEMKGVKIQIAILSTTVYVYSYKNSNGTDNSFKTESAYVPNKYSDIIMVTYSDTADGLTTGKSFGATGWVYELNVDLDKLSGYKLDFSKMSMSVNGVAVTDFKVNGNAKPTSLVAVTAGGVTYTLTATIDGKEYTATYKVTGTETSKESPSLVASNYEAGLCVASSHGGTWHGAAPALQGIQIKYWSVAEKQYKTINLADYTPTTKGQQNGTNTTWTYTHANNDFTLTLTGGQVHSSNNVYAMPVVCEGKLYFVAASSKGLVNSGNSARTIPVSYSFKDNNGGDVLTFSHTWSVAENKDAQYKYSDFCNGTLTKLEASSGGGSCVTPETLVTLADGTQVRVDSLTGSEKLLVWNMETGMLDSAPIMFVDNDPEAEYEVVHLYFSDGTDVKVIYEHGFWDYDLNKYVYLDANAAQYIGHTFAKQNGDELAKVQLTDVVIEKEVTTAWSPVTADHLCYFVNGMLSMPGGVGGLFNIFDVNPDTMTYDMEALQRDIETYGLYTYEELNAIVELPEEMFNAAGGAYMKISMGKGNLTMDELIAMINRYKPFF